MIGAVGRMLSCHATARRVQRYLDADPAAPLTAAEVARLEAHLAECARCAGAVADFRALREALRRRAARTGPDLAAVHRMHVLLDDLAAGRR